MSTIPITTYGPGGYDPDKADRNVTETSTATVPTEVANADTLRERAKQALDANKTFLAKTSPTNAEVVAQVKLLTRECSALIRLAIGTLDATD